MCNGVTITMTPSLEAINFEVNNVVEKKARVKEFIVKKCSCKDKMVS